MTSKPAIFIHSRKTENVNNEEKYVYEEFIRDGSKGLTFKYYTKTRGKKNTSYKIKGIESGKNKFKLTIIKDDNDKKEFDNVDLKDLAKHSELKFLEDYIKKHMEKFRKTIKDTMSRGKRKKSKKKNLKNK